MREDKKSPNSPSGGSPIIPDANPSSVVALLAGTKLFTNDEATKPISPSKPVPPEIDAPAIAGAGVAISAHQTTSLAQQEFIALISQGKEDEALKYLKDHKRLPLMLGVDSHGYTPLFLAERNKLNTLADTLRRYPYEARYTTSRREHAPCYWATDEGTALAMKIVEDNDLDAFKIILKVGELIFTAQALSYTAFVAQLGRLEMLNLLVTANKGHLNAGADYNLTTPLMAASESGQIRVVEYLLDEGAITDCTNRDGKTALQIAEEHGHSEVAELIRGHAAALASTAVPKP